MRNATIDGMKGIGIILVVIYHVISVNVPGARYDFNNGLYNVIAAFFMQLFMVVSGYLASSRTQDKQWVMARTIKCLIPTLVFTAVYWAVTRYIYPLVSDYDLPLHKYIGHSFIIGFNGLVVWYLWTLILCYGLAYGLECVPKRIPLWATVLGTFILLNMLPMSILGLSFLKWYGIFFFSGYMLGRIKRKSFMDWFQYFPYPSLFVFPLFVSFLGWLKPYENTTYGMTGYTNLFYALTHGQYELVTVMLVAAIMGVCFVYTVISLFTWDKFRAVIGYLGQSSIGIFLLHYFFVGVFRNVIISTLFSLCVSLVLYEGLKRIKVTNFVLFGGTDIPMRLSRKIYSSGEV